MIAPKKYYVSVLFQTSVDMTDSKEGRQSLVDDCQAHSVEVHVPAAEVA